MKVMKKLSQALILTTITLSLVAGFTQAADEFAFGGLSTSCFSYPEVVMTPYDDSTQSDQHHMTHEQAYHNDGATGTILLYGPVHPWIDQFGDGVSFAVTFRDPDGPGTEAQVLAELRFVGPGGIRTVSKLNSNDHAHETDNTQSMSTSLGYDQISRTEGYYIVRLYITRTNTNLKPVAFGYNLCSAIF